MAKVVLLMLLVLFVQQDYASAQGSKDTYNRMKTVYVLEQLSLDSDAEAKFLPIYRQYLGDKDALREKVKEETKGATDMEGLSDQEYEELINNHMAFKQRSLDLDKKFQLDLKTILSPKKIAELYSAEKDFILEMRKKMRKR